MEAKAKELFYESTSKEVDGQFSDFTLVLSEVQLTTSHYPRRYLQLFVYDIEESVWPPLADDATDEEINNYRATKVKKQTKIARSGVPNDHLRKAIAMVDSFLGN